MRKIKRIARRLFSVTTQGGSNFTVKGYKSKKEIKKLELNSCMVSNIVEKPKKRLTVEELLPAKYRQHAIGSNRAASFCKELVEDVTLSAEGWCGKQKNIVCWFSLANGKRLGVNDYKGRVSFPVI